MKATESTISRNWPGITGASASERPLRRRGRARPDVSGYFTVILIAALTGAVMLGGDLLRMGLPLERWVSFLSEHPMSYVVGCCAALLAGLLAIGDV